MFSRLYLVLAAFFLVAVRAQLQTITSLGETIVVQVTTDIDGDPTTSIVQTVLDPNAGGLTTTTPLDPGLETTATATTTSTPLTSATAAAGVTTTPSKPASSIQGTIADYSSWLSKNSPTTTSTAKSTGAPAGNSAMNLSALPVWSLASVMAGLVGGIALLA
ncbi:hypothetical protein DL96DRAFT_1586917 [Flagelloscypha sp. PMI_526]|nr:hypothetical protein DL96DRAFT_1586917 [Flagelloscypha sp. PMI_526]